MGKMMRRNWMAIEPHKASMAILVLFWIAFLAVDLAWQSSPNNYPLWRLLFREAGIVEHLTWLALASTSLLAMFTAAKLGNQDDAGARFWFWFSIGSLLLLIEDAGNTSHSFAYHLNVVIGNVPHNTGRLFVFITLAAVMLYALLAHRGAWLRARRIRRPLLAGFVMYGIAAFLSVPMNVLFDGGYQQVGDMLLSGVFRGRLAGLPYPVWGSTVDNTGEVFMDLAIEESLEFLAASLLSTAAFRGLASSRRHSPADPVADDA